MQGEPFVAHPAGPSDSPRISRWPRDKGNGSCGLMWRRRTLHRAARTPSRSPPELTPALYLGRAAPPSHGRRPPWAVPRSTVRLEFVVRYRRATVGSSGRPDSSRCARPGSLPQPTARRRPPRPRRVARSLVEARESDRRTSRWSSDERAPRLPAPARHEAAAVEDWENRATTDLERTRNGGNYAIACGPSRLLVSTSTPTGPTASSPSAAGRPVRRRHLARHAPGRHALRWRAHLLRHRRGRRLPQHRRTARPRDRHPSPRRVRRRPRIPRRTAPGAVV